jgi:hypothetical protein
VPVVVLRVVVLVVVVVVLLLLLLVGVGVGGEMQTVSSGVMVRGPAAWGSVRAGVRLAGWVGGISLVVMFLAGRLRDIFLCPTRGLVQGVV